MVVRYTIRRGRLIVHRGHTKRPADIARRYEKLGGNQRVTFLINGREVTAENVLG